MNFLRFNRQIFKIIRALFRISGIGKIRIGNTLIYQPIRKKLYRFIWEFAAPDLDKAIEVEGNQISGIGLRRGGTNGMGLLMNNYEEETTHIIKELTKEGMSVIDIGAHIGYYTLLSAKKVGPSGVVYAFEPELENYRWLQKNIKINGYNNVIAVNKAVSEKTGSLKLWLGDGSGTHSLYPEAGMSQKNELVKSTTIDDFLEAENWPSIGLIKIDVEGAEYQVFNGMKRLLRKQNNLNIIFEFNRLRFEEIGINPLEFLQSLETNNFKLYSIGRKKANILSQEEILSLCNESRGNINLLACKGFYEN